jgi:hypothetical protein
MDASAHERTPPETPKKSDVKVLGFYCRSLSASPPTIIFLQDYVKRDDFNFTNVNFPHTFYNVTSF